MTTIGNLDSYFISLINNLMQLERQPVERLKKERDTVDQTRAAYSDVSSKLKDLQDKVQALISTDAFYDLSTSRSTSVINRPADSTVLSATASSSAVPGQYDVSVTRLARAERQASIAQSTIDGALGLTGSFWLGGHGTAEASGGSTNVSASGTSPVGDGLRELGTGDYKVEIRSFEGKLQFRVKDASGNAVAVDNKSEADDSLTSGWQTFVPGETFDTRRGFTLTFGEAPVPGESTIHYQAAGVKVEIKPEDTLIGIAKKLNAAVQPEGREVKASVVGKQLVLTAGRTGTLNTLEFYTENLEALGDFETIQTAQDAEFTVNGIQFSGRQSNTGLTDVIHGITLNLAEDAEGKQASLVVSENFDAAKKAVEEFVKKFNEVNSYLALKTSVEKVGEREYKRGILADESIFSDLRISMLDIFSRNASVSGRYKNLRDLGLELGDDLSISFSDTSKFEAALKENRQDVVSLLDSVMRSFDAQLARFTGNSGYLDGALNSYNSRLSEIDDEIKDLDARLAEREQYYVDQYSQLQVQLLSMTYSQQMWSGIYNSLNRTM